jgi:hypothetical protein
MNIQRIVLNAGMRENPGYYTARGATTSDLNLSILNKIADAIKIEYGEKALSSFVKMV